MTTATIADAFAALAAEPWRADLWEMLPDYLEEQGQGGQAELVRLQKKMATCRMCHRKDGSERKDSYAANCGRCVPGRRRESALLKHCREWAAPLVAELPRCETCQGRGYHRYREGGWSDTAPCEDCHGSGLAVKLEFPRWPVASITCTLRQFVGEECGYCNGMGGDTRDNNGNVWTWHCSDCGGDSIKRGRGYVNGLALLAARWPCEWVLGDRIPYRYIAAGLNPPGVSTGQELFRWWCYRNEDEAPWEHQSALLPEVIDEPLRKLMPFPTAPAAALALSQGCRDLARSWAGLDPWPKGE